MMRPGRHRLDRASARGGDGMTWKPLDMSQPNAARVHNALVGGHDNFAADRELAGRLLEICPDLGGAVRETNRVPRTAEPVAPPPSAVCGPS